jgi:hypothetical protein
MVKGETIMPVPEGIISTSTGPVNSDGSLVEEIIEADLEEAIEWDEDEE